jgi:hypothetical protein
MEDVLRKNTEKNMEKKEHTHMYRSRDSLSKGPSQAKKGKEQS